MDEWTDLLCMYVSCLVCPLFNTHIVPPPRARVDPPRRPAPGPRAPGAAPRPRLFSLTFYTSNFKIQSRQYSAKPVFSHVTRPEFCPPTTTLRTGSRSGWIHQGEVRRVWLWGAARLATYADVAVAVAVARARAVLALVVAEGVGERDHEVGAEHHDALEVGGTRAAQDAVDGEHAEEEEDRLEDAQVEQQGLVHPHADEDQEREHADEDLDRAADGEGECEVDVA